MSDVEQNNETQIHEVKGILNNMVQAVIDFCMESGKLTASEKRVVKAMKTATKELTADIIALYQKQAEVDDMTLLEVVDRNRQKILNDIYQAALTPTGRISKEAMKVINMVATDLLGPT